MIVAVADVLDNSIADGASEVHNQMLGEPVLCFCMLYNGNGMATSELVEAMRLDTKNPNEERNKTDLGRFGLA